MNELQIYILKVSLLLSGVYLIYLLILQRLTFYTINRWYLLLYTVAAFLTPLVKFNIFWGQESMITPELENWLPYTGAHPENNSVASITHATTTQQIFLLIIASGIVVMIVRFVLILFSFYQIKKTAAPDEVNGIKILQVNKPIAPFSFGHSIFINLSLYPENELKEILHHEMVHVKQLHTADIILGEIICILNWFNPFAWLLKKAMRQNLEFIADEKVLQNGVNKKMYQYFLLKVTSSNRYALAAPFNYSSLKKRIVMMNKSKSRKLEFCKLFLLLPATLLMLMAFSSKAQQSNQDLPSNIKSLDIKYNKASVHLKDGGKENYNLNVASEKIAFEAKYGTVPVAPPKHVPYPRMNPTVKKAPDVRNISVTKYNKAIVYLKNGGKEEYDLNIVLQKSTFETKYGKLPTPPPEPPAPPVGL